MTGGMINFMKKLPGDILKGKKGFTLMELLVSVAIFSITVVIGIDLFFNIVDVQKRTSYVQAVQGDARYLMEEIARQLRQGYLDYEYYIEKGIPLPDLGDSSTNENKILVTRDLDNNRFYFARRQEGTLVDNAPRYVIKNCAVEIQTDALDKCDDLANWQTVTPAEVHVKKFLIFPTPLVDPLVLNETLSTYEADDQPKVTIIFQTETDRKEQKYKVGTDLQTTVSTRIYAR